MNQTTLFLLSVFSVTLQMAGLYWLAKKRMILCLTHFIASAIVAIILNVIVALYTEVGFSCTPFIALSIWQIGTSSYRLRQELREP